MKRGSRGDKLHIKDRFLQMKPARVFVFIRTCDAAGASCSQTSCISTTHTHITDFITKAQQLPNVAGCCPCIGFPCRAASACLSGRICYCTEVVGCLHGCARFNLKTSYLDCNYQASCGTGMQPKTSWKFARQSDSVANAHASGRFQNGSSFNVLICTTRCALERSLKTYLAPPPSLTTNTRTRTRTDHYHLGGRRGCPCLIGCALAEKSLESHGTPPPLPINTPSMVGRDEGGLARQGGPQGVPSLKQL